jgi:hypothetical protein
VALSFTPTAYATVTTIVGTSQVPSVAIPDNCKSVLVTNRGANDCLVGQLAAGPGAALVEGVSGFRIVAGQSITIPIGTISQRGVMNNAATVGTGLLYDGLVGVTNLDIMYLCVTSGPV